jgi:chromosome segregation ATPase
MSNTEDLVLDRIISALREVKDLKDKPRLLKAEIASLEATRDRAKAQLQQVRDELNDPNLLRQKQQAAQKIRKEITDREAERDLLVTRVAALRVEFDRLEALCQEKLNYHDQILDSVDSLKKHIGVAVDPNQGRISKGPAKELTGWDLVAEREKARQQAEQAAS